jgi:glycosyltransferase involved in cell wall biosynthesis
MRPKLTVLMTVFQPNPILLRAAITSVLEQTFEDFEFLIIEDPSSSDGSAEIGDIRDPRLHYVLNRHRTSLVRQKNQGIEIARGEYVAMMDADDIAMPNRLEAQLCAFEEEPGLDVVGSNIEVINADGAVCGRRQYPTQHREIIRAMPYFVPFCHPSTTIRRSTLLAAGGYHDNGFPIEDYELWSRLALRHARFANVERRCLQYRIHHGQVKAKRLRDCIRGVLAVKTRYWKEKMGPLETLRMWAESALLWLPPSLVYGVLCMAYYRNMLCTSQTVRTRRDLPRDSLERHAAAARPSKKVTPAILGGRTTIP